MLRFEGFFDDWVLELHVLLPPLFGMVAVALPSLGSARRPSPPGVAFSLFQRRFAALLAALEILVGAVAVSSDSSSQFEWVELESAHEPEPPCTMVDTQGTDVFDILAEARMQGLDEQELMHFVFEHGVSEGLRLAECQRGQVRARDRLDDNLFDLLAIARRRGWDEHELTHMVFEFGEEEGMRMIEELTLEDDVSSVVLQGGVVQEPRVCLSLDELLPVNEVRQACEASEKRSDTLSWSIRDGDGGEEDRRRRVQGRRKAGGPANSSHER